MNEIREPNCLDYFGVRRTPLPCPHFVYTIVGGSPYNFVQTYANWITANLSGRFYVGKVAVGTSPGKWDFQLRIGFENPKELTYFQLICPHLRY